MKRTLTLWLMYVSLIAASCSSDDNNTANTTNPPVNNTEQREYQVQIWGEGTSAPPASLEITYYGDAQNGILIPHIIHSQTNQDIVETHTFTSYNRVGFKFDADDNGEAYINTVVITDVEANEIIFENNTLEIDDNEIFIYNISGDNYSIQ